MPDEMIERMRHVEEEINKVADQIANEGMIVRAAKVRSGAIMLAEARLWLVREARIRDLRPARS